MRRNFAFAFFPSCRGYDNILRINGIFCICLHVAFIVVYRQIFFFICKALILSILFARPSHCRLTLQIDFYLTHNRLKISIAAAMIVLTLRNLRPFTFIIRCCLVSQDPEQVLRGRIRTISSYIIE